MEFFMMKTLEGLQSLPHVLDVSVVACISCCLQGYLIGGKAAIKVCYVRDELSQAWLRLERWPPGWLRLTSAAARFSELLCSFVAVGRLRSAERAAEFFVLREPLGQPPPRIIRLS